MGLEAISRGAVRAVMVDQSREAVRCIWANIAHCAMEADACQVFEEDIFSVLPYLEKQKQKFDIIYVDPPFTVDTLFEKTMHALESGCLLAEGGMVVIRTRTGRALAEQFGCLQKFRLKTYGESQIHFYEEAEKQA